MAQCLIEDGFLFISVEQFVDVRRFRKKLTTNEMRTLHGSLESNVLRHLDVMSIQCGFVGAIVTNIDDIHKLIVCYIESNLNEVRIIVTGALGLSCGMICMRTTFDGIEVDWYFVMQYCGIF